MTAALARPPRARLSAVLLGACALASELQAKEIWERKWLEVTSPNFVVISQLDEKSTRTITQELEDFRQVVAIFTNARVLEPRVPTQLYVFSGPFRDIGLAENIAGYFEPRMRANYAVARRVQTVSVSHIIQHEYTHFLLRNQGRQAYPRWYDEGLADLLGTVNLREGAFDFGNAPRDRLMTLGSMPWLDYDQILAPAPREEWSTTDTGRFYAQSWALLHYLIWGREGADFSAQLARFLESEESGKPPVEAFELAFGEDVKALKANVRRYLAKARYGKGKLKNPFDPAGLQVRRVRPDEIAAAMGHLCMVMGDAQAAARYVDAALAANSRNASALVYKADLHKTDGRFEEAKALYEQAIAIEPDNDLHHLDFGEFWLQRARSEQDPSERTEYLKLARRQFVTAHDLNENNPETLAVYGSSFLLEGEPVAKGLDTLELAHELLPSNPQIKLRLARIYAGIGRAEEARSLLLAVRAWEEGDYSTSAAKLLEGMESLPTASSTSEEPAD